ncbi:glycoside hydrolase family 27 protein [Amycolatopsis sp. NPDC001319]|uniref:glycoside hydrolase family 27 protein n=1 Tax=unclassified Amycolatopsis TaxID=2618356 RepID=UPI0036A6259F
MKSTLRRLWTVAAVLVLTGTLAAPAAQAKTTFVTPFMGWSSWSVQSSTRPTYGTSWLVDSHIRDAADAVSAKLKSAGYTNINLDAGWNANFDWVFHSDANGIADPDPGRFPNGIAPLASYVHGKGLKIGLYAATGLDKEVYDKNAPIAGTSCHTRDIVVLPLTPSNMWGGNWKVDYSNPCAQKYYDSVVAKFASWDVDFLKVDGTTADNVPDIAAWSKAIDHTGRAMWLTAGAWPVPREAGPGLAPYANSVRVDTDVECYCGTVSSWDSSVKKRWDDLPAWQGVFDAGYRPDLDSMPISNNTGSGIQDGLDDAERQSVMTFWSMASSPLYVGGDVYFLDDSAVRILTNPEVISVDRSGTYPAQVAGGTLQVWKKQLPGGKQAVAVYNLGSSAANIPVSWSSLGLSGSRAVRDLVARADLGSFSGSWTATAVPAHGSRLITVG